MPVVTTRPRGLGAWAGRPPSKGLNAFRSAGEILFASGLLLIHTLSMYTCGMPALKYGVAIAEADHASSGVSGRSPAATPRRH